MKKVIGFLIALVLLSSTNTYPDQPEKCNQFNNSGQVLNNAIPCISNKVIASNQYDTNKFTSSFIKNQGQIKDKSMLYYVSSNGRNFYFTRTGLVINYVKKIKSANIPGKPGSPLQPSIVEGVVIALNFVDSAPVGVEGLNPSPGKVNYFSGNDSTLWKTGIPTFNEILYSDLYPGINLRYIANSKALKYQFEVKKNGNPEDIKIRFTGIKSLDVDSSGNLVIHTGKGNIVDELPEVYQLINDTKIFVDARFKIIDNNTCGFTLSEYDPDYTLILDPALKFSTYIGGSDYETDGGITIDSSGYVYITGTTTSLNFPVTPGTYSTSYSGGSVLGDVYVTKISPDGSSLIFSTFVGGSGGDIGYDIELDSSNNVFVTGLTRSNNFPVTPGAFDTSFNGGDEDVFVFKLNNTGTNLLYSTYIGGLDEDLAYGMYVDSVGRASITGGTLSLDFPVTSGAYNTISNGSQDIFVSTLNPTGSVLLYSTFLGGSITEIGWDITIDSSGYAYVAGITLSNDFPVTSLAYDKTINGYMDVVITKFNLAGTSLLYSTYLGGLDQDAVCGIQVDSLGNAYVAGYTKSIDFPTTPGAYDTFYNGGPRDAFVSKLNSSGTALMYSTYIGSTGDDPGYGFAVDASGNAYLIGNTNSINFPVTPGAFDSTYNGNADVYLSKLSPDGSTLLYSTYFGGWCSDFAGNIVVDNLAQAYVQIQTSSPSLPQGQNPGYDTTFDGFMDAFIFKISTIEIIQPMKFSSLLGGENNDSGWDIWADNLGNAYVLGISMSPDFPTTTGTYGTSYPAGSTTNNVYVTKLAPDGSTIIYSSFFGGRMNDVGTSISGDTSGNVYVSGYTKSPDFPTTLGAYDTIFNGGIDAFTCKLSADGSTLKYSSFLGGVSNDYGMDTWVDSLGYPYIIGSTSSYNFPLTTGVIGNKYNGGYDVFVTKLSMDGTSLVYSTFLGGNDNDYGYGITVDATGNAYLTGSTLSMNFPTTPGAYNTTKNYLFDVFATKLSPDASTLKYSLLLGDKNDDLGYDIAINSSGDAFVVGTTNSLNFPVTSSAYDSSYNGGTDVFVSRIKDGGASLVYSTYLGGIMDDIGLSISVDTTGNAYLTGATLSIDYPVTSQAHDPTHNIGWDVFVSKLNDAGSVLYYSSFFGGYDLDQGNSIFVDDTGMGYVTGFTRSSDFPFTLNAFDTTRSGNEDSFVFKIGFPSLSIPILRGKQKVFLLLLVSIVFPVGLIKILLGGLFNKR